MEITWTTTQLDGAPYVLIESDDSERVTILDRLLIPIGQIDVFLGGPAWSATRFRPDDFSSHAFHTYREALDYLVPGLAHALLD